MEFPNTAPQPSACGSPSVPWPLVPLCAELSGPPPTPVSKPLQYAPNDLPVHSDATCLLAQLCQCLTAGNHQDQARASAALADFSAGPPSHVTALIASDALQCLSAELQGEGVAVAAQLSASTVIRNIARVLDDAQAEHVMKSGGAVLLTTLLAADDTTCHAALEAIESFLTSGAPSAASSPPTASSPLARRRSLKLYPEGWSAGAHAASWSSTSQPHISINQSINQTL